MDWWKETTALFSHFRKFSIRNFGKELYKNRGKIIFSFAPRVTQSNVYFVIPSDEALPCKKKLFHDHLLRPFYTKNKRGYRNTPGLWAPFPYFARLCDPSDRWVFECGWKYVRFIENVLFQIKKSFQTFPHSVQKDGISSGIVRYPSLLCLTCWTT